MGIAAKEAVTVPEEALCSAHPARAATTLCARCGTFLCGECIGAFGERLLCDACSARARAEELPLRGSSKLARVAAAFCFIGLCLPPFAAVGLLLATIELVRIQRGSAPRDGRFLTLAGLVTALAGLAIYVLFIAG